MTWIFSFDRKWYFLETVADGLKNWLKARTVGIRMAFNRLLSFHVVRSTRPCTYVPACFIGKKEYRNLRDPGHIEKYPQFPDPQHHALTLVGRSSLTCRMCLGPTLNEDVVLSELHAKVFFPPHIPSTSPCGLYKRNYTDTTVCLLLYSAAWSHCIVFALVFITE